MQAQTPLSGESWGSTLLGLVVSVALFAVAYGVSWFVQKRKERLHPEAPKVRIPPLFILFMTVLACFYLFAVPVMAPLTTPLSKWTIAFGLFCLLQLWMLIGEIAFTSLAEIYGFPRKHLFFMKAARRFHELEHKTPPRAPSRIAALLLGFVSYIITIYGFAIIYLYLSVFDVHAFNTQSFDFPTSLYFSVVTMATVGFGDFYPVSRLARIAVCSEIFANLGYTVFFFSTIASFAWLKPRTIPPRESETDIAPEE